MSDRVLVIVPTYDEVENLERILDRLHASAPVPSGDPSSTTSACAPGTLERSRSRIASRFSTSS